MNCVVCDAQLPAPASAGRPRRYCSAACRRRAYHARQLAERPVSPPERGHAQNAGPQVPEPLLAAIVFVPVDGADSVYVAQSFGDFPWQELLADLRDGRNGYQKADGRISPPRGEIAPSSEPRTKSQQNKNEIPGQRGEFNQ